MVNLLRATETLTMLTVPNLIHSQLSMTNLKNLHGFYKSPLQKDIMELEEINTYNPDFGKIWRILQTFA